MANEVIHVGSYTFEVEFNVLTIKKVYLYGGGVNIKPLLNDDTILLIFDELFKDK